MDTMSVRGTITSRARVSPSSKTECSISRSSASIRAWSRAMSTRSRSSLSLSNGPSRNPLPGVTALVRAMSSREKGPSTRATTASVTITATVDSAMTRRKDSTDRYAAVSLTTRTRAAAPGRRSSSSSWARVRDIRENAASAVEMRKASRVAATARTTRRVMGRFR